MVGLYDPQVGEVLLSADLHLGHETAAIKFRGFPTVEAHNRYIIDAWRDRVREVDRVFLLGDAIMGTFAENVHLLGELTGDIVLVRGNHDRNHPAYQEKREHKRAEAQALYDMYVTTHPDLQIDLQRDDGSRLATLCHFPPEGDHTDEDRYVEFRPTDEGQRILHGHVHDLWADRHNGRWINVGVDVRGMAPVGLDELQAQYP